MRRAERTPAGPPRHCFPGILAGCAVALLLAAYWPMLLELAERGPWPLATVGPRLTSLSKGEGSYGYAAEDRGPKGEGGSAPAPAGSQDRGPNGGCASSVGEPRSVAAGGAIAGSNLAQDVQGSCAFREWLHCVGSRGQWVWDPHPRFLAWPVPVYSDVAVALSALQGTGAEYAPAQSPAAAASVGPRLEQGGSAKYRHCDRTFLHSAQAPRGQSSGGQGADGIAEYPPLAGPEADKFVRGVMTMKAGVEEQSNQRKDLWNVRPALKYSWQTNSSDCTACSGCARKSPTGHSWHSAVDASQFCSWLLGDQDGNHSASPGGWGGGSILIVGDSLQAQLAESLVYSLRASMLASQAAGAAVRESSQDGDSQTNNEQVVLQTVPLHGLPCHDIIVAFPKLASLHACFQIDLCARTAMDKASGRVGASRLLFVRNDFLSLTSSLRYRRKRGDVQIPWLHYLRDGSASAATDGGESHKYEQGQDGRDEEATADSTTGEQILPYRLVVLNRGAHYVDDVTFVTELNATLRAVRGACPKCLIFFRNTPPGHVNCTSVTQPLHSPQPQEVLPFNWGLAAAQSQLAQALVDDIGGVYLDVATATALRGDGHLGKHRRNQLDCLHYCEPGPIDLWVLLMYNALSKLISGS